MRARELIGEGFLMGRMKGEEEGVGLLQASQRGPGVWKAGKPRTRHKEGSGVSPWGPVGRM